MIKINKVVIPIMILYSILVLSLYSLTFRYFHSLHHCLLVKSRMARQTILAIRAGPEVHWPSFRKTPIKVRLFICRLNYYILIRLKYNSKQIINSEFLNTFNLSWCLFWMQLITYNFKNPDSSLPTVDVCVGSNLRNNLLLRCCHNSRAKRVKTNEVCWNN